MNLVKLMPKHEIDKKEPHKRIKKMYTILMMQLSYICKIYLLHLGEPPVNFKNVYKL